MESEPTLAERLKHLYKQKAMLEAQLQDIKSDIAAAQGRGDFLEKAPTILWMPIWIAGLGLKKVPIFRERVLFDLTLEELQSLGTLPDLILSISLGVVGLMFIGSALIW